MITGWIKRLFGSSRSAEACTAHLVYRYCPEGLRLEEIKLLKSLFAKTEINHLRAAEVIDATFAFSIAVDVNKLAGRLSETT